MTNWSPAARHCARVFRAGEWSASSLISTATRKLEAANPAVYQAVTVEKNYVLGAYKAIDPVKAATITDEAGKEALKVANTAGQFSALGKMAIFPTFMLCGYICLILYFKSKGGYKAVHLVSEPAAGGSEPPPQPATV